MAARRLIIVLVVLLGISVAAAAIAPPRPAVSPDDEESTTTTADDPGPVPSGDSVERQLTASQERPGTIRAEVGDQLFLNVESEEALEIEIEQLGLIGNADPVAPAHFDLLLAEAQDIAITDAGSGALVGRLIVESPGAENKPK